MSKTGKHGHAKFTFNLSYPFTGQTSQEMFPGHTHLHRPEIRNSNPRSLTMTKKKKLLALM